MPRLKRFRRKVLTKRSNEIAGLPELINSLNALGEGVENDDIYRVLLKAGFTVRDEIKDLVAYDPNHDDAKSGPHIRDVIFASEGDPSKDPRGPNILIGVKQGVLKPTNRAQLLERGTSRTRAQPFFRPGIAATRQAAASIIEQGLKEIIDAAEKQF